MSFSASTSLAFSQLLKRDDFHKFAKFYLKLVHRFLDEKISITHEFISEVVSKYGELCEYEEYVTTLLKMVTIYDQFNWEPVSYYAVKEIHDPENPLMNTWLQILVILSQRNIQFDDKIIKQICRSLIRKTEDNLYEALWNIIENKNTISKDIGKKLEQLFHCSDNIKNIQLLEKATQHSLNLSEDTIEKLESFCTKKPKHWNTICKIFSNLNDSGFELSEDQQRLSYFIKDIKVLGDWEENYSRKLEAIESVLIHIEQVAVIPDVWVKAIQDNLRLHKGAELNHKWYEVLQKLCQKEDRLVKHIDWHIIVSEITNLELEPIIVKLFSTAIDKGIKFRPGVLSILSRSNLLDDVIQLLIQYKDTHGAFSAKDECCQNLINIHTRDIIESPEELEDYIQGIIPTFICIGEGYDLSEKALETFKKSFKNLKARKEIMKFLNKRLCLGNKIDPILDSYIRYIPTTERVAYIAPLLVQEVIAKDQLVSSQPGKVYQSLVII